MMSECSVCDTDELSFYWIRLIKSPFGEVTIKYVSMH